MLAIGVGGTVLFLLCLMFLTHTSKSFLLARYPNVRPGTILMTSMGISALITLVYFYQLF